MWMRLRENRDTDGSFDIFWHRLSPSQVVQLSQERSWKSELQCTCTRGLIGYFLLLCCKAEVHVGKLIDRMTYCVFQGCRSIMMYLLISSHLWVKIQQIFQSQHVIKWYSQWYSEQSSLLTCKSVLIIYFPFVVPCFKVGSRQSTIRWESYWSQK